MVESRRLPATTESTQMMIITITSAPPWSKAEGGRRKAEGGRRKAEGGRRREEERGHVASSFLVSLLPMTDFSFILLLSAFRLPPSHFRLPQWLRFLLRTKVTLCRVIALLALAVARGWNAE